MTRTCKHAKETTSRLRRCAAKERLLPVLPGTSRRLTTRACSTQTLSVWCLRVWQGDNQPWAIPQIAGTHTFTHTHSRTPENALSLLLLLLSSLPKSSWGRELRVPIVLYCTDLRSRSLPSGISTIPTSTHCYPAASPLCLHSGPVATPIYGPLVRNVAPRTVENPATTTAAAASSVLERERHDTCT